MTVIPRFIKQQKDRRVLRAIRLIRKARVLSHIERWQFGNAGFEPRSKVSDVVAYRLVRTFLKILCFYNISRGGVKVTLMAALVFDFANSTIDRWKMEGETRKIEFRLSPLIDGEC